MTDFNKVLTHLREQALEAGEIMRHYFRNPDCKVYIKPDKSKVTDADLTISTMVQKRCAKAFPEVLLYSEETNPKPAIEPDKSYFVIDELDGTSYFAEGVTGFSHLAAYYDQDAGLAIGVIYYPLEEIMLFSLKGQGAFMERNGELSKLEMPKTKDWNQLIYAHPKRYRGAKYMDAFRQMGVGEARISYVTGLRSLQLAVGEVDVIPLLNYYINPWDMLAEKAFVEELGFNHSFLTGATVPFTDRQNKSNKGYLICPPIYKEKLIQKLLP